MEPLYEYISGVKRLLNKCLDLLKLLNLFIEIYGKKHLLITKKDN